MGFPIDLPSGKGMTINYMLCIIALSCFFSGASAARWWRLECKRLFCYSAKSVTEKKQQQGGLCGGRQKDRASPALRHAQRADEKGWGFLAADGCPVADRNKLSGKA